ncbi:hypothetical protein Pan216_45780 [Planctomycetes bacterium Pan216]|uniref:Uncharacterized protein n=1 Tax=Kolteria novifilia TaxID=2527975 RepID=A0A518B9T6_9BACT|nr:hypothetical protein Pan216_45780 [Planctomycetes bacterium Pan216]
MPKKQKRPPEGGLSVERIALHFHRLHASHRGEQGEAKVPSVILAADVDQGLDQAITDAIRLDEPVFRGVQIGEQRRDLFSYLGILVGGYRRGFALFIPPIARNQPSGVGSTHHALET